MGAPTERIGQCGCGAYGRVVERDNSPTTRRYRWVIETENGERHTVESTYDREARRYRAECIT